MGLQRYLGASSLYGRKRSRLAGPHDPKKPEIKEFNMLHPNDRDGYTSVEIFPWMANHVTNFPASGAYGAWTALASYIPPVGPGPNERIGSSIYLRGIQIRGYVQIFDNCLFPCNWRLVLYRQKRLVGQGIPTYADLYKNWENMDLEINDVPGTLAHYRHNFYKAMYNQEYNDVGTRQVLAKGRVVPCVDDPKGGKIAQTYEVTIQGNKIGYTIEQREVFSVSVGYQPIKKIVKCNIDLDASEDMLYFMLETDYPYGAAKVNGMSGGVNVPNANVIGATLDANNAPFKFNIFVRGYYTDP